MAHVDTPLDSVHAFTLLGGTAVYLFAHVALRLRDARSLNIERLAVAVLLFALIAAAQNVDALYSNIVVNLLLWGMVSFETLYVHDERRYRLRHDMEVDIPGRREG